jgi:hypothetical protein
MAQIQSGVTADLLTIDPTSKAARVTPYDSSANEQAPFPTGAYSLPVNIRQTAASAANSTVWTMRNGASKKMFFRRILLEILFDGTASAGNTLKYMLARFTAATPTGGTSLTPVKMQTTFAASTLADARFLDTGLTTTGITFETEWATLAIPASVTAQSLFFNLPFIGSNEAKEPFVLNPNEGLAIRLQNAAIIGLGIVGSIHWDER